MIGLNIRRMNIDDVAKVYQIEKDSFPIPWSQNSFLNDINNNKCARYLVACIDDKIVGYCGIWIILDEGHVTNIAISKEYRNLGIGKALFSTLISYSAQLGVRYITLEVRKSNSIAQKIYSDLGFYRVSIRKRYYEDNHEDAFIMVSEVNCDIDDNFSDENYSKLVMIDNK